MEDNTLKCKPGTWNPIPGTHKIKSCTSGRKRRDEKERTFTLCPDNSTAQNNIGA